ncbi:MAG: hypothetical protein ACJ8LN_14150, partial [Sulfurifustis sp.]
MLVDGMDGLVFGVGVGIVNPMTGVGGTKRGVVVVVWSCGAGCVGDGCCVGDDPKLSGLKLGESLRFERDGEPLCSACSSSNRNA